MRDTYDLLVIIAGEDGRLSADDRRVIRQAAEELKCAHTVVESFQSELNAATRHVVTLRNRVNDLEHEAVLIRAQHSAAKWSMGTGWVTVQMREDGTMVHP